MLREEDKEEIQKRLREMKNPVKFEGTLPENLFVEHVLNATNGEGQ